MSDIDVKLMEQYLDESRENLATVETDLLGIEKHAAEIDEAQVNRLFRAVRTVKEGSVLFDLSKIGELAHKTENVVSLIRSRKMLPTTNRIAILLHAVDKLNVLMRDPEISNEANIADLVAKLETIYADCQTPSAERTKAAGSTLLGNGGHLRMLVVEDDFACRLLLQKFLSRFGECNIRVNGKEAIEACRLALDEGRKYDLICMDIMMPEIDGREAVRRIRALEQQRGLFPSQCSKIIMTTTVNDLKDMIYCFEELCDDYLVKPIDLAQVQDRMKQFQLI